MHDLIFANQQRLRPDDLAGHAQAIRLDEDQLKACLSDPQTESLVAQNAANAKELGVGSTPFFLIGAVQSDGKMLVKTMFSGARPVQEFETAFESVRAGL
jgi:predicted DsbA family dithiol-disulfide isomerase